MEVRRLGVGVSLEQVVSAWIRAEQAPGGSLVVIDHEVAGRLRGGAPWRPPGGAAHLAAAVVVRPPDLRVDAFDLLWVVALSSAADVLGLRTAWPDRLVDAGEGMDPVGGVGVSMLSGRAGYVTLRARLAGPEPELASRFAAAVTGGVALLAEPTDRAELERRHAARSAVIGRRVIARLAPRGEARGEAVGVDERGALLLRSPTGMVERVAVDTVRRVDPA